MYEGSRVGSAYDPECMAAARRRPAANPITSMPTYAISHVTSARR
jgi:hypothetical protein